MVRLYGREWSRSDLLRRVGRIEQIGGVRLLEAADGTERGSRLLQVRTGTGLMFDVLADKALDISSLTFRGVPLAWSSPAGDVHPAFYEAEGLGFLRSFQGGLFVTGGLDQFGAPSSDQGEEFGLHGRISHLPARAVACAGTWAGDEYEMQITGEVRQYRLFGENLVLRRTISTRLGSSSIRIHDVVTNEGFSSWSHMILYHFNLGFPLISPVSQLDLPAEHTEPRDADAEAGLSTWQSIDAPTPGYREQVFRHVLAADRDQKARVQVTNPELGIGVGIAFSRLELPYLFQWKMMSEGAYVLGIEPANCSGIEGRAAARQRDDLPHLAPGESRTYILEVEVLDMKIMQHGSTQTGAPAPPRPL